LGEVIDRQFKGAKMALGRLNPAFGNGKLPCPRRGNRGGRLDQDGDIEMFLQKSSRLDGSLVRPVDEDHAFALESDEGHVRERFSCDGDEGCHFWPSLARFF
jgi:hypothetical protein